MRTYLLAFFGLIRNNICNEKHNLILWFPVFQCIGILIYFSLDFEPSFVSISILFLSTFVLTTIFYKRYFILCIILIAVTTGFTASKLRTSLTETKVLLKERYLKDIVATVKDINDKGLYKQFLLGDIKPSVIPVLDTQIQKKNDSILVSHAGMTSMNNIRISIDLFQNW